MASNAQTAYTRNPIFAVCLASAELEGESKAMICVEVSTTPPKRGSNIGGPIGAPIGGENYVIFAFPCFLIFFSSILGSNLFQNG